MWDLYYKDDESYGWKLLTSCKEYSDVLVIWQHCMESGRFIGHYFGPHTQWKVELTCHRC